MTQIFRHLYGNFVIVTGFLYISYKRYTIYMPLNDVQVSELLVSDVNANEIQAKSTVAK